jgi:GT2 family glycosyltransferase
MSELRAVIGIPTLNGSERLDRALFSIFHFTERSLLSQCVVLVADDGSDEEELEKNKKICAHYGVEILFGHGRTGVAATWNRLCRHSNSKAMVLINDDIEVVADWLDVLLYSVEENKHAGMVSLSCIMGALWETTKGLVRIDYHEANLLSANNALLASGGAIFAFRRDVYDLAGGFDQRYFCFYEEIDFGVTLGYKGFFHYIANYPNPFHLGGQTTSSEKNISASKCLVESREKFAEKWQKTPDVLRKEFAAREAPSKLLEWNSQIKFLHD